MQKMTGEEATLFYGKKTFRWCRDHAIAITAQNTTSASLCRGLIEGVDPRGTLLD